MLFGRGNWAVVGLKSDSLQGFKDCLTAKVFLSSQVAASTITKFQGKNTLGINPFASPRLDEELNDPTLIAELAKKLEAYAQDEKDTGLYLLLQTGILDKFFGKGEEAYRISPDLDWFGFWVVMNEYEDVTDIKSKLEGLAYKNHSRPFKFLNKEDKKPLEQSANGTTTCVRAQFPVLLDFKSERVYIGNTKADNVDAVRFLLQNLGAETFAISWKFGDGSWPQQFINEVHKRTKFASDFQKRADETTRFKASEIEPLEDKAMERIVSQFFALAELDTALWAGLTTNASLEATPGGAVIGASEPPGVTLLFQKFDKAQLLDATVVFQELVSKFNKKGEEKQVRYDLFTMNMGGSCNLFDSGAAVLKGFDLPGFKKSILREIKKTKQELTVQQYWGEWLRQMNGAIFQFVDNICETLGLKREECGLQPFDSTATTEEEVAVGEE